MEQTINILTDRERQLDDIDQAIRETEYPPLNGGPTIQDLAGLLKGAAATIEELGDQVDEMEDCADRRDELQDKVNEAEEDLKGVICDLKMVIAATAPKQRKELEDILDRLREIHSDLWRA